jgi:hypothetical protein
MLARNILIIIPILLIASCSKDIAIPVDQGVSQTTVIPSAEDYYPLTVGNYWVYDYYVINTLSGVQQFQYRDSVYIVGDTIINGYTYAHQENKSINGIGWAYLRDSSGYMVMHKGAKILFSCCNFTDTFSISHDGAYTVYTKMIHQDTLIPTPLGNFHSISLGYLWHYTNNSAPLPKNEYLFFGKGIGMTQYCHWYYPGCIGKIEGRLVKYHLN